jgi:hypothetical protein
MRLLECLLQSPVLLAELLDQRTTLMIRNIPKRMTQRQLLAEIDLAGYLACVDFVYLPTDISQGRSHGFAFVNFELPEQAAAFKAVFHKKHFLSVGASSPSSHFSSGSGLSVSYADIQGLEANLLNVRKNASINRIKNPEYLPLVRQNSTHLIPLRNL